MAGGDDSQSDNEGKKATAPQPGVKYGCRGTNVREAGFCMGHSDQRRTGKDKWLTERRKERR